MLRTNEYASNRHDTGSITVKGMFLRGWAKTIEIELENLLPSKKP